MRAAYSRKLTQHILQNCANWSELAYSDRLVEIEKHWPRERDIEHLTRQITNSDSSKAVNWIKKAVFPILKYY